MRKIGLGKRVLWVDDDEPAFNRFKQGWDRIPVSSNEIWTLEFADLNDFFDDSKSVLADVLHAPPDVLLLDWQEGDSAPVYQQIRQSRKQVILLLMSMSPAEMISADTDCLAKYPGLSTDQILVRPFDAQNLRAFLRLTRIEPQSDLYHSATAVPAAMGAWRWLDAGFNPVRKSLGWIMGINRPEVFLNEAERESLKAGEAVDQWSWRQWPSNPDTFGRLYTHTRRLGENENLPKGVQYVQHAVGTPLDDKPFADRSVTLSVIEVMKQAGFPRARFYYLSHVPGLAKPVLELLMCEPSQQGMLLPPAALEMDQTESVLFTEFRSKYIQHRKNKSADLIHKISSVDPATQGSNDLNFWGLYVDDSCIEWRLEVPVFFTKTEILSRNSAGVGGEHFPEIRGLFVFDLGVNGAILERQIAGCRPALLAALKNYAKHREAATEVYERKRQSLLAKTQEKLEECATLDEVAQAACNAVVDVMKLSERTENAKNDPHERSCVFMRYNMLRESLEIVAQWQSEGGAPSDPVLRVGDSFGLKQERFFGVRAANDALTRLGHWTDHREVVPVLIPRVKSLPDDEQLTEADWGRTSLGQDSGRVLAAHSWYSNNLQCALAWPVVVGGALAGVLVVRSNRVFELTNRRVDGVGKIVRAMHTHVERVSLAQQRQLWHGLLAHELRNVLGRTRRAMDLEQWDMAKNLNSLATTVANASIRFLFDHGAAMQKLDDQTTDEVWPTLNSFGQALSDQARGELAWQLLPEQCSSVERRPMHPSFLLRVLLVLLDNAFLHGFNHVSAIGIKGLVSVGWREESGHWLVQVNGPGKLPDGVAQFMQSAVAHNAWMDQGAQARKQYFGLTLVRILCEEVGSNLTLSESNNQVCAKLQWPLAPLIDQ